MTYLADAHRDWHTVNGWDTACPLDCGVGEAASQDWPLEDQPDADEPYEIGDVVEDSYGNPAVVIELDRGRPASVIQTVGSDRGKVSRPGAYLRRVRRPRADAAREIARQEWRANPARYSRFASA